MDYEKAIHTKNTFVTLWIIVGVLNLYVFIQSIVIIPNMWDAIASGVFTLLCVANVWMNHDDKDIIRMEKEINEDTYRIQDRVEERIRELEELEG